MQKCKNRIQIVQKYQYATRLIPIDLLFQWWRSFTVPDTKVAPFS